MKKDKTDVKIAHLNFREKNLLKELEEVRNERASIYAKDTLDKIDKNKIYKIGYWEEVDYEEPIYGIIHDCWFSVSEGKYIINVCGLCHQASEHADNTYSLFNPYMYKEFKVDNIKAFVGSLEEVTEEQFNSYVREWLDETEKGIKEWFEYFKNKDYEKENEE